LALPTDLGPGGRPQPSGAAPGSAASSADDAVGTDLGDHLLFEADTIEPGTTPLKWKLNIAQPPVTACS
jgi:hypothetical protein